MEILFQNLSGWLTLFSIFFFIFFWTKKYPEIKNFLLTAFLLRVICVLLSYYNIITLPDSYGDADYFEEKASEFSKNYGLSIIFNFFVYDSLLISKLISFFYTLFGESKLMAQSISTAFGTASVYLVYNLCLKIWDNNSAKKAAWVAALFPTLILYSSYTLREVYIVFFLLIGLQGIIKFLKNYNFFAFLQVFTCFYILVFIHGAAAIGGFVFLFYLILGLIKIQLLKLYKFKISLFNLIFISILSIPFILLLTDQFKIPYLPNLFDLSSIIFKANIVITDTASYPSFLIINNNYELFTKVIIRAIYFLYSPFIWDIKTTYHMIGLFDAILYLILSFYVIVNWRNILNNPITRVFILLFISYLILHGLGTGNFGTGIRHRSKFVVILIILAAPKIKKFILNK